MLLLRSEIKYRVVLKEIGIMRTILYNAKVYVEKGMYAEAVLICDGRISKVGSNDEVLALKASADEIIDCGGKTLIPGLNDSHLHLFAYSEFKNQPSAIDAKTVEEVVKCVSRFAENNPEAVENGIYTLNGYNRYNLKNKEVVPTRFDLDKISTQYPIILDSSCIYYRSVNTKVIEMCGITEKTEVPDGGKIMLGDDGKPNGVLWGNAIHLVSGAMPTFSLDFYRKMLIKSQQHALEHGLTSMQGNDIGYSMKPQQKGFDLLKSMVENGELKIRFNSQTSFGSVDECEEFLNNGEFATADYGENALLSVGSLKLLRDGNLFAKTAMMKDGYSNDPDNHGAAWHSIERVRGVCELAYKYGATVSSHAIGDAAIEEMLDIYEEYFGKENAKRSSIIHCNVTDEKLIERLAASNVPILVQPAFINTVRDKNGLLYDEKLAETSNAIRTLIDKGVHVAFGTDAPITDFNPFPIIYSAVTRKVHNDPYGDIVYNASEAIDVETAIDAYTIESAYAEFLEHCKGRIKEGYYADMALISKDIFTCPHEEIPDIVSDLTIVKGEIVYRRY